MSIVLKHQGLWVPNQPEYASMIQSLQDVCQLSVKHYDIRLGQHVVNTEKFWTQDSKYIVFPRHLLTMCFHDTTQALLQGHTICDQHDTRELVKRVIAFHGTLRTEPEKQDVASKACVDTLTQYGGAVLTMPPGRGKTITACHVISAMHVSAVVLVHTHAILTQWIERIEQYLPNAVVAEYKNHQVKSTQKGLQVDIVVATLQSVCLPHAPMMPQIGLVIVDEAHHICATSLRQALHKINAPFTLGLTATPERKDQRTSYLYWALGPPAFCLHVPYELPVRLITMVHKDEQLPVLSNQFKDLESRLCLDHNRVYQVLDNAFQSLPDLPRRNILILATRLEVVRCAYTYIIEHLVGKYGLDPSTVFRLNSGKKATNALAKINGRILLSSDKLVNEGFDVPRLDTLIRLMPTTETKQTVGRVMRTHPGKVTPVCIIEVDDICSPMLHNMWRKRVKEIQNGDKHGPFTSGPCTVETIEMKACTLGPIQSRRRYRAKKYM